MAEAAEARDRWPIWESVLLFPAVLLVSAYRSGLPWAPTGEPPRYFDFAGRVLGGLVPYRDIALEYPPLALAPWILPRLIANDVHAYAWLLAIQNAALATAIGVCLTWLARRGWSAASLSTVLATALLLLLGVAHVVVWLFDLLPALLVVLALVAVARDRPATAGVLLALGSLVKVFPVVLIPVVALWYLADGRRRHAGRLVAGSIGTAAVAMLPVVMVAGSAAFSFVDYYQARGAQLESVPAGLAMLAASLGGTPVSLVHGFGSWQIEGALARQLAGIQTPLLIGGLTLLLAGCVLRFHQDARASGHVPPARLIAYGAAAVLVAMIASKVLSPQFLVWLLPLAPLLPRPQAFLAVAVSLLTAVLLGDNYAAMMRQQLDMVLLLNLRNLLLVVLLAWIVAANAPSRGSTSSVVLTAR